MSLDAVRGKIKIAALSNSAKLLAGYMKATGVSDAKQLADVFDIPVRTIQRLKLDIACATDGAPATANDATGGAANSANCATDGVSESANAATGGASQKEIPPTPPKEKTTHLDTSVETNNQRSTAREGSAAALPSLDELEGKLRDACNGSLANPAVAQGLFDLSIPIMWIKSGADLDLDIIPTLRGIGKREHGKNIGSWKYFTKAVTQAKAQREAGLPAVDLVPAKKSLPAARWVR